MFGPFKPAPHIAELPQDKIDPTYKRLRWQVFMGIFFGYAAYYFVRANFDLAQKGLIEAGLYNKAELGIIGTGAGLAYGLSKFVMASISDRSNPKVFLPFGLLLSGLCMTMMGLMPWATSGIAVMFVMIFLNGWFQGMVGSKEWVGLLAVVLWFTGGQNPNVVPSYPFGTARITSVV